MLSVVWHEKYFMLCIILGSVYKIVYTHDIFCSAFFRFFLALSHSLKVVLLTVGLYIYFHSFDRKLQHQKAKHLSLFKIIFLLISEDLQILNFNRTSDKIFLSVQNHLMYHFSELKL